MYKHIYHSTMVDFQYYPAGTWALKRRPEFNKVPYIVQFNNAVAVAVFRLKAKPGVKFP